MEGGRAGAVLQSATRGRQRGPSGPFSLFNMRSDSFDDFESQFRNKLGGRKCRLHHPEMKCIQIWADE